MGLMQRSRFDCSRETALGRKFRIWLLVPPCLSGEASSINEPIFSAKADRNSTHGTEHGIRWCLTFALKIVFVFRRDAQRQINLADSELPLRHPLAMETRNEW
jgi:hypothetical protein